MKFRAPGIQAHVRRFREPEGRRASFVEARPPVEEPGRLRGDHVRRSARNHTVHTGLVQDVREEGFRTHNGGHFRNGKPGAHGTHGKIARGNAHVAREVMSAVQGTVRVQERQGRAGNRRESGGRRERFRVRAEDIRDGRQMTLAEIRIQAPFRKLIQDQERKPVRRFDGGMMDQEPVLLRDTELVRAPDGARVPQADREITLGHGERCRARVHSAGTRGQ